MTVLWSPISLAGATAPNRLALAPMTNKQSAENGTLSEAELQWLALRARGGFGSIITGGWAVADNGRVWDGQASVYDDRNAVGLRELSRRLRPFAALGIVQLIHGGSRHNPDLTQQVGVSASDGPGVRAATEQDITALVEAHRDAALRVQAAGLHGVEIHSAHGYLPAQFLSRTQNLRTDSWGGDLAGRSAFLQLLVRTIRHAAGPDLIIGVRLSAEDERHGIYLTETAEVAQMLYEAGATYIHLSLGDAVHLSGQNYSAGPIHAVKAALPADAPVIAAGGVWTPGDAQTVLDNGADMVALGQAAIYNPDWAEHARDPFWTPSRPPFTRQRLYDAGVSEPFVGYLHANWPGSVTG